MDEFKIKSDDDVTTLKDAIFGLASFGDGKDSTTGETQNYRIMWAISDLTY